MLVSFPDVVLRHPDNSREKALRLLTAQVYGPSRWEFKAAGDGSHWSKCTHRQEQRALNAYALLVFSALCKLGPSPRKSSAIFRVGLPNQLPRSIESPKGIPTGQSNLDSPSAGLLFWVALDPIKLVTEI